MTTDEYLYQTEETTRRRELVASVVREPPAPYFSHQQLALKVARELSDYVEARDLGVVAVAPVDVVLDRENNVVLQPDVLFVAENRLSIIRNRSGDRRISWSRFIPSRREFSTAARSSACTVSMAFASVGSSINPGRPSL
jgi:Uma2 family endonuclease